MRQGRRTEAHTRTHRLKSMQPKVDRVPYCRELQALLRLPLQSAEQNQEERHEDMHEEHRLTHSGMDSASMRSMELARWTTPLLLLVEQPYGGCAVLFADPRNTFQDNTKSDVVSASKPVFWRT